MGFGWEGELVRLAPLDRTRHLDNALRWLNDPEITRWTKVGDWPLTRPSEEEFFHRAETAGEREVHFAIETLAGEHIGFSGLLHIELVHGVARTGSFIGRSDLWGQGLGADAARVRARYAFDVLGLRLLVAEVMAENERSLRMLTKVGYLEVGRIPRRFFKRGAFRDVVLLALERAGA